MKKKGRRKILQTIWGFDFLQLRGRKRIYGSINIDTFRTQGVKTLSLYFTIFFPSPTFFRSF